MKTHGVVESIMIAPQKGAPLISLSEVEAVAGKGLVGDRNFTLLDDPSADKNLTLIEAEKVEEFARACGLDFSAADSRRNLLTRGIELNPLLGKQFYVGAVLVEALELCEPCNLLAKRTHRQVLWGLLHRGGLRCRILTSGTIHMGDKIGLESD